MLDKLKTDVFKANLDLVNNGLVIHTWGNVSARDSDSGMIVIKPSGVSYKSMKPDDMVVIDPDGKVVEGKYKPSTDAPTHLLLYRTWAKYRRNCTYSFIICHSMGTGRKEYSSFRNHPCRSLLRRGTMYKIIDRQRDSQ